MVRYPSLATFWNMINSQVEHFRDVAYSGHGVRRCEVTNQMVSRTSAIIYHRNPTFETLVKQFCATGAPLVEWPTWHFEHAQLSILSRDGRRKCKEE